MLHFEKIVLDRANPCEACGVFDVNNDGILDIVSGEYWYEGPGFQRRHKICDLTFDGNYLYDFSDYPMDVDGDGYMDILTASWWDDGMYWRKNPGAAGGLWETHKILSLTNVETVRYYDIDGDGQMEIFPNCPSEPVFFLKLVLDADGKGTGEFTRHVIGTENAGHGLGVGDIDGDGKPEVLVTGGILHMPAGGVYAGAWDYSPEFDLPFACCVPMLVHDVNRDGLNDVIVSAGHNYGLFWLEQKQVDGKRTWEKHVIDGAWSQYHDMQLIDIDGDGELELVTGKRFKAHNGNDPGDSGEVFVCYYTFRDGGLYRHIIDYGDPCCHSGVGIYFAVEDLDGNGKLDIVAPGKEGLYLFRQV